MKKQNKYRMAQWLMTCCVFFSSAWGVSPSAGSPNSSLVTPTQALAAIRIFAEKWAPEDPAALTERLREIKPNADVLRLIQKPAESFTWSRYQGIFLTSDRIQKGIQFWKAHRQTLARAEKDYGVNAEVILAILGVETRYGQDMSRFNTLEALTTLAFYYPPRAHFFQNELGIFLKIAAEEQWDLDQVKGSYAGALGFAQFIPSSYQRLAVDYNHDGKRDLFTQPEDAIGSIGNYLKNAGWQVREPIVWPAHNVNHISVSPNEQPHLSLGEWQKRGIHWDTHAYLHAPSLQKIALPWPLTPPPSNNRKAALLSFSEGENLTYWLSFANFYVITRYNHSALYAMAVTQLAAYLRTAWEQDKQDTSGLAFSQAAR